MQPIESILVVVDLSTTAADAVAKAVRIARGCSARIELFMCDAERAFMLSQAYVPAGVSEARRSCLLQTRRYLESLRDSAAAADVQITVDAMCESPLYQSIVRKVMRLKPRLIIKNVTRDRVESPAHFTASDWQLMRSCPGTLILTRGRAWQQIPRLAAAVDVSAAESPGLARDILKAAQFLGQDTGACLDIIHAEPVDLPDGESDRRARDLQDLASSVSDLNTQMHVLSGTPEVSLPRLARQRGYDALLLGALTHEPEYTVKVGTLTSKLMDALDCDFILLKPGDYRSPIAPVHALSAKSPCPC